MAYAVQENPQASPLGNATNMLASPAAASAAAASASAYVADSWSTPLSAFSATTFDIPSAVAAPVTDYQSIGEALAAEQEPPAASGDPGAGNLPVAQR